MVQKMLKSMKKWASYAIWKWRGWFGKIEHNNSVCVFEFKFFICCSIPSNVQTNFVVLFLAHLMVQKMLKSIKIWTSYALWKWRWFAKTKHNSLVCAFEFKLFLCCSIPFDIHTNFVFLLFGTSNGTKNVEIDKEMNKLCLLKVKNVICKT
jgi:hypothetical protein